MIRCSFFKVLIVISTAALLLSACRQKEAVKSGKAKILQIAVIPKGTTHEFWKSVHAGALKAAGELGNVNIIWKGPQKEDDRESQITVVDDFISRGVDGIVLAPLDNVALKNPVRDASKAGIPVVIIDSGLEGEYHKSFVATNNFEAGKMAGRHMGALLGGKGQLLVMRYMEGSASTMKRENGFLEVIRDEFPQINILSDNQYAGPTTETALARAENLLIRFPQVEAVYCPNESSTFGMLKALQDIDKAGAIKFVGFDASEGLVRALSQGQIQALIVQNPMKMGQMGVEAMVKTLRGDTVQKVIDTGAEIITRENMNQPDMQTLLNPPLDKYLKS